MTASRLSFFDGARRRLLTLILLCAAPALLFVGAARAGQLQVMPTRLGVSLSETTTTMFATNADTVDASYQVAVFSWSQHPDGSDQLDPTRDVLANPAIFTVKPGEQQVIRFGLRSTGAADGHAYRVVLQELPHPNQQAVGIQTLLRISVPIFVPEPNPIKDVQWTIQTGDKALQLTARNRGNVHLQITGIAVDDNRGQQVATRCSVYVLPGITRTIPLHATRPLQPGATYHLRIDTDQGPMTAELRADSATAPPAS